MGNTVYTYAGFWKRFFAYIIDSILINVAISVVFFPLAAIAGLSLFPHDTNLQEDFSSISYMQHSDMQELAILSALLIGVVIISLIAMVISWLYFALMECSSKKATLGKMALGLIVTDMTGTRLSFGRASGRFFAKILSGLILNIGFIMAAFTEKKQALHDMLAGTLVLEVKRHGSIENLNL